MCLIILQPIDQTDPIPFDEFAKAHAANHDGIGYAYVGDVGLVVCKPYWSADEAYTDYLCDWSCFGETSPFLIHFRLATAGEIDSANTHPWLICNGQVAVAHNGILGIDPWDDAMSDTMSYLETVFWGRPRSQLMGSRFARHIGQRCDFNKFVLIDIDGGYSIINDHLGAWRDGRWYSNEHCFLPPAPSVFGKGKRYKPVIWQYDRQAGYRPRVDDSAAAIDREMALEYAEALLLDDEDEERRARREIETMAHEEEM